MTKGVIAGGAVHGVPKDFSAAIAGDKKAIVLWQDITLLARNEWICCTTYAKQDKTRERRIAVGLSKMCGGMRRLCCWAGCSH